MSEKISINEDSRHSHLLSKVPQTIPLCRIFTYLALMPILVFLIAVGLSVLKESGSSCENLFLVLTLDFIFSFGTSVFITCLMVQSFLAQGRPGILPLGAGVLTWGFAGIVLVISGIYGQSGDGLRNVSITIYNCCAGISGFIYLVGAALFFSNRTITSRRVKLVTLTHASLLTIVGLISVIILNRLLPPFFIRNDGGMALRQFVLSSSIVLFSLTIFIMWWRTICRKAFIYWYCLALTIIAIGLAGVMLQIVHGGIACWLGRSALFLSGPYTFIAALHSLRELKRNGFSLEEALIGCRKAEDALHKTEEQSRLLMDKYRLLFTNTSNGMVFHELIIDEHGIAIDYKFLEVNPAFERLTGLNASTISGKTAREIYPGIENDPGDWIVKFSRVALQGEQICFEQFSRLYQKWFSVTAFQTVTGQFGVIFKDITARKQYEQKLAFDFDAMTRLQRLGAFSVQADNLEPVLTEIVDAAIAISGADFGNIQLVDPVTGDLHIAAQRGFPQWWLEFWETVSNGNGTSGIAMEQGERIIVENVELSPIFAGTPALEIQLRADVHAVQSTPLISRSGKIAGMFSTHYRKPFRPDKHVLHMLDLLALQAADIIVHAQDKSALRKSEALLRAVTDNNLDPIFMKDRNSRMLFANPATLQYIGKTAENVIGKTDEEFYENPEDGRRMMENDRKVIESGSGMIIEEVVSDSNGSNFCFLTSKSPWYDEQGQIAGLVGVAHEITDRKKYEQALQLRTEELTAANKELESFSYSVSHDLRTPLRAIKGFSDILLEDYAEKFDDEGWDLLRRINTSTQRMAEIVDNMLRLARISREAIQRNNVDLKPVVTAIINDLRRNNPERNVTFTITDQLPAFADEQLMNIALSNLIGNAWKYTGGNPDARIDMGYMHKDGEDIIYIRDNGAGFDMKLSHKLFKPFQRLHSDDKFPGTGTGLAIVCKIIKYHNGKIWAESEPGKGAAFFFTLENRESNIQVSDT